NVDPGSFGPFYSHAAFAIDWGYTSTGIQASYGHRRAVMNAAVREVGIGIVDFAGAHFGPHIVTEDFGDRKMTASFLLGTVIDDQDGDGFYNPGEGLAGVAITVSGPGGTVNTVTSAAGGYQVQVPPGTYTVMASGGAFVGSVSAHVAVGYVNA